MTAAPHAIRREDYTPPPFLIDFIDLKVELGKETTAVASRLAVRRNPASAATPADLVLDGKKLELVSVLLDDQKPVYETDAESLTIRNVPDRFVLNIDTKIRPQDNTELTGLYVSRDLYCTQCEAEGFRRITYFLDRPDVMSRYTTTIVADHAVAPVLLSNGNLIASGDLGEGRRFAKWEDPFPKPSYLFALVAGRLESLDDKFVTRSGREVSLHIYVRPGDVKRCRHAMDSLKKSMKWDEDVYGLEYDLDIFMIVAVDDFNMGAMENKGLNIFNSKLVLADPETATDSDYHSIEAVIAHEYFHNWTGNRVTCQDWFQLSLKEGLTVFRDQQFSSDMGSAATQRIGDVRILRAGQFPEDASPMAHPVRRTPTSRSTISTPPPSTRRAPRSCACSTRFSAMRISGRAWTSTSSAMTARRSPAMTSSRRCRMRPASISRSSAAGTPRRERRSCRSTAATTPRPGATP